MSDPAPNLNASPIALIVGTGMADLLQLANSEDQIISTPYGAAFVTVGRIHDHPVVLMKRHGQGHSLPPHKINFHANINALKLLGARACISTSAVGSLRKDWHPGTFAVLSDFIDYTRRGVITFFDTEVAHTGFSEPFDPRLRTALLQTANDVGVYPEKEAVYLCADGPRYETPAEVKMFRAWGADVVGMTVGTEAILAREMNIPYATMAVVTNLGTGISETTHSHEEVEKVMRDSQQTLTELFKEAIRNIALLDIAPAGAV